MRKPKLRLALAAGLAMLAAVAVVPQASATPPPWAHGHGDGGGAPSSNSIDLIAPWGPAAFTSPDTITLSYSVSASKSVAQTAVQAALAAASTWSSWLSSHDGSGHFNVQQGSGGVAVPITIKNGGGTVAGQTKLSYDRQGFIKGATVQISGSSFGLANDYNTVYEIVLHELGHAFVGLGHSTDPTDLMYPTLNGTTTIGTCEAHGFDALYGWLEDGNASTGPTRPSVSSTAC
jgi:matrixin